MGLTSLHPMTKPILRTWVSTQFFRRHKKSLALKGSFKSIDESINDPTKYHCFSRLVGRLLGRCAPIPWAVGQAGMNASAANSPKQVRPSVNPLPSKLCMLKAAPWGPNKQLQATLNQWWGTLLQKKGFFFWTTCPPAKMTGEGQSAVG